eukprot:maker-scaffold1134_size60275-snap-gene-0.9 protein:Tk10347 transcript:maker-scaffold1134_size60275-snap-gene-0.9-mRNA-1 annotation:"acetyltransferase"
MEGLGNQDRYIIKPVELQHFPGVIQTFKEYLASATLSKNVTEEDIASDPQVRQFIVDMLVQNVSVVALDKSKLESTGSELEAIVGHMVNYKVERSDETKKKRPLSTWAQIIPLGKATVMYTVDCLVGHDKIFQDFPDINTQVMFHSLYVRAEHRKQGIGNLLVEAALKVAQALPNTCGTAMCTSPYSRKIFDNFGFEQWEMVDYSQLVCQENGQRLFPKLVPKQVMGTGHFKRMTNTALTRACANLDVSPGPFAMESAASLFRKREIIQTKIEDRYNKCLLLDNSDFGGEDDIEEVGATANNLN